MDMQHVPQMGDVGWSEAASVVPEFDDHVYEPRPGVRFGVRAERDQGRYRMKLEVRGPDVEVDLYSFIARTDESTLADVFERPIVRKRRRLNWSHLRRPIRLAERLIEIGLKVMVVVLDWEATGHIRGHKVYLTGRRDAVSGLFIFTVYLDNGEYIGEVRLTSAQFDRYFAAAVH